MNIKPDDKLAYIVAPFVEDGRGHFVTIERRAAWSETFGNCHFITTYPSWVCRGAVPDDEGKILTTLVIADECLRPIRDNPGDESFVTESRKSLPAPLERAKPAEVEA